MAIGSLQSASLLWADVPDELEPDYSEATLAFNARNYPRALQLLNQLMVKSPQTIEFIELKALTLKATNKDIEAGALYDSLIKAKTKEHKSDKEIAPYTFELGMIRFKEKKLGEATKSLKYAKNAGFNSGAASFYLGLLAFQSGQWGEAEDEFNDVLNSSAGDLRPVALFYMAQANLKTQYLSGAIQNLQSAQSSSKTVLADKSSSPEAMQIAKQIQDGTEKALKPFDAANYFATLSALTGYDSNALSIPDVETAPLQTTGKNTFKETVAGTFGHSSSPIRTFQFVPSYHGSITKNFNSASRSAEFADNTVSLYLTHNALAVTSYGLKAEGTVLFQDQADPAGNYAYHLYETSLSAGPYFKTDIVRRLTVGIEFVGTPQFFAGVPATANLDQSGNVLSPKLFFQNSAGRMLWNPTLTLRYNSVRAKGADFQATIRGAQLLDILNLTDKLVGAVTVDYAQSSYPNRQAGSRLDKTLMFGLSGSRKINKKWTALGNADYTNNNSSVSDIYTFSKYTVSLGASYNFF